MIHHTGWQWTFLEYRLHQLQRSAHSLSCLLGSPTNSAPLSPGFVLRARLIQFDTENSVRGAKGFVFAALTQAKAQIS